MTPPRLAYDRKTAAEMCSVSVDTIARAVATGALKAKRLTKDEEKGGKQLFTEAALKSWLDGLADA